MLMYHIPKAGPGGQAYMLLEPGTDSCMGKVLRMGLRIKYLIEEIIIMSVTMAMLLGYNCIIIYIRF